MASADGATVTFGTYEQDNDITNGPEPIEWIILDMQDGKAFLISKYVVDCKPYTRRSNFVSVTWETSTMRRWLNSDFVKTAFDTTEQKSLVATTVDNSELQGNSVWGITGGNNTQDRIFLLSYAEANNYFDSDKARLCQPTAYAKSQGVGVSFDGSDNCLWWLRSPGFTQYFVAYVRRDGSLDGSLNNYTHAGRSNAPVRPAMWINLETLIS